MCIIYIEGSKGLVSSKYAVRRFLLHIRRPTLLPRTPKPADRRNRRAETGVSRTRMKLSGFFRRSADSGVRRGLFPPILPSPRIPDVSYDKVNGSGGNLVSLLDHALHYINDEAFILSLFIIIIQFIQRHLP